MRRSSRFLLSITILLASSAARAESPDGSVDTLRTSAAPPPRTPNGTVIQEGATTSGRLPIKNSETAAGAATVLPTPLPFVALPPCRIIDTPSTAFTGHRDPPSMPGVPAQRTFNILRGCGIPSEAQAVSFNFTVSAPESHGDIRAFPAGATTSGVSTLKREANLQAIANAAVVALGTGGAITVQVDGPGTIDLIVDVTGCDAPHKTTPVKSIIAMTGNFPQHRGGSGSYPDQIVRQTRMFAGTPPQTAGLSATARSLPSANIRRSFPFQASRTADPARRCTPRPT